MEKNIIKITIYSLLLIFSSCNIQQLIGPREPINNDHGFEIDYDDDGQETVYNNDNNTNNNHNSNTTVANKRYDHYNSVFNVTFEGNEDLRLLNELETWLGVPYKWAGNDKNGVDCSGFVKAVYDKIYSKNLGRRVQDINTQSLMISPNKVKFGDFVIFKINGKSNAHIGIYLGNDKFIHASSSKGVMVSDMNLAYWKNSFQNFARLIN